MIVITTWRGGTAHAFRLAYRMTVEGFANHLGLTVRAVAKWDAEPDIVPVMQTQQLLDFALKQSTDEIKARFSLMITEDKENYERSPSRPGQAGRLINNREAGKSDYPLDTTVATAHRLHSPLSPTVSYDIVPTRAKSDQARVTSIIPVSIVSNSQQQLGEEVLMAARRAFRFSTKMEGSNVGLETMEQLRDEVRRLATAYQLSPIHVVFGDLVNVQDIAFRLLEGQQRPDETRELYLLAGIASGMLANASHDLGDNHAALMQGRTAYICAENANHDSLRAWVRGVQSMVAYWAGWTHDALRYADLASEAASRIRGTAAVWLPALRARAWAVLDNANEVQVAIEEARGARERVIPSDLDEIGGKLTFPLPRQLYYAADASAWLTDGEAATAELASAALSAYESADPSARSYVDESVARTDLALARVRSSELDGAREALLPVLDLTPSERVGGILVNVNRLRSAVRDPRYAESVEADDFLEELESFSQMTAEQGLTR